VLEIANLIQTQNMRPLADGLIRIVFGKKKIFSRSFDSIDLIEALCLLKKKRPIMASVAQCSIAYRFHGETIVLKPIQGSERIVHNMVELIRWWQCVGYAASLGKITS
jgi:hypothetical protein